MCMQDCKRACKGRKVLQVHWIHSMPFLCPVYFVISFNRLPNRMGNIGVSTTPIKNIQWGEFNVTFQKSKKIKKEILDPRLESVLSDSKSGSFPKSIKHGPTILAWLNKT